jgi:hypothetical protein
MKMPEIGNPGRFKNPANQRPPVPTSSWNHLKPSLAEAPVLEILDYNSEIPYSN